MPISSIPTSRVRWGGPGGLTAASVGRGRAALVVLLLCAAAVLAGPAGPAQACSCVENDPVAHFQRADAVFIGTLVDRTVSHPDFPAISSADPARHVFAVERVLKGEVHERQAVVSPDSGASCGLELEGDGPFAVFAQRDGDGYRARLCGGSGPLTPDLQATLEELADPATGAPPTGVLRPGSSPEAGWWTSGRTGMTAAAAALVLTSAGVLTLRRRRGR